MRIFNHFIMVNEDGFKEYDIKKIQGKNGYDMYPTLTEMNAGKDYQELMKRLFWMNEPIMMKPVDYPMAVVTGKKVVLAENSKDIDGFIDQYTKLRKEYEKREEKLLLKSTEHEIPVITYKNFKTEELDQIKEEINMNELLKENSIIKNGTITISASTKEELEEVLNKTVFKELNDIEIMQTRMRIENRISKQIENFDISKIKEPIFISDASNPNIKQNAMRITKDKLEWYNNGIIKKVYDRTDPNIDIAISKMVQKMEEPIIVTDRESQLVARQNQISGNELIHDMIPGYKNEIDYDGAIRELREKLQKRDNKNSIEERIKRIKKVEYKLGNRCGDYTIKKEAIDRTIERVNEIEEKRQMKR